MAEIPPGLVVAWQAKLTTQPSSRFGSFASQAPIDADLGSTGPAGSTISGLPRPGCVTARPSLHQEPAVEGDRRLDALANPARDATRRSLASQIASIRACSTLARYFGSTIVDSS